VLLRDKNVRHAGIERVGDTVEIKFRDAATRQKAKTCCPARCRPGLRRCGRRQRPENHVT
jgi:preprotein translocase subunit SecD